jgi:hypothetical protein
VFLRVLDYYTGILFLTTNRSGALDEAFKSRIHYKIYYGPLSKDQTMDIWRLNIQRLRHINEQSEDRRPLEIVDSAVLKFAELQFEESNQHKAGQWNGRQIRNAFQVARSLAYYDAFNETEVKDIGPTEAARPAVLDVKYFHMMHEITESFDHYMLEVFSGMNDGNLALEMEHRADHFKNARPYRSAPLREEFDDQYNGYNARSSFDNSAVQEFSGRVRSASNRGSRPSLSAPGNAQRYSPSFASPLSAAYDETNMDDKPTGTLGPTSPRSGQRHSSLASEGPATEFRGGLSSDGDYTFQSSSFNSRFGSGLGGIAQSRSLERGGGGNYGLGRDTQGYSNFDVNTGYR